MGEGNSNKIVRKKSHLTGWKNAGIKNVWEISQWMALRISKRSFRIKFRKKNKGTAGAVSNAILH